MIWFLAAIVLILQIAFWGAGLALLTLPDRWRPFWPFLAPVAGLGLQSATVWFAAHTALPGTDSYGVAALAIPIGLLGLAIRRFGVRVLARARRWWSLGLLMALCLAFQTAPMASRSRELTSVALGSCDAADYAGGARVLKEFSSRDRSGYLGVREVLITLSVDNFFDYWLRLNHFAPSALIALNATLMGRQPYEIASLFGVVLFALNLPSVFWLARSVFRFRPAGSLAATAIYGCSPILFYAVSQVALGQLLAAPAVALIFWAGWQGYRAGGSWRRVGEYYWVMLLAIWLLLGGYNFFILFAFVPLAAYVGVHVLVNRTWPRAGRLGTLILLVLLSETLLFPERVISLVERFRIMNDTGFGWPIAGFQPSGWYGAFRNVRLGEERSFIGWMLLAGCLGGVAWAGVRRGSRRGLAAACTLPILCGYGLLLWKDACLHDNASYDAYKLFSVFYPGMLLGICLWLQPTPGAGRGVRLALAALTILVLGVNISGSRRFVPAMAGTPTWVQRPLAQLSEIERMADVPSVNVLLPTNWETLWANSFLLHTAQYFRLTEYEARHISPLKGEWDLRGHFLDFIPADARDRREIGDGYYLVRRRAPDFVEAEIGRGWYPAESGEDGARWTWSSGSPEVIVINPGAQPVRGVLGFSVRGAGPRRLALESGGAQVCETALDGAMNTLSDIPVDLLPGVTRLRFVTSEPPTALPGDSRPLTFALYGLQIRPRSHGATD